MHIVNRSNPDCIALETTLLTHGIPREEAQPLARELVQLAAARGVGAALVGVVAGRGIVGLTEQELEELVNPACGREEGEGRAQVFKANTANLGAIMFRRQSAATTVSTTMELAAAAGLRLFATGGLGGVHRGYGQHLDISSDLLALSRFPLAVIASGIKSILDVSATREAMETLGLPVIGFRTDTFPAFYLRETDLRVDFRFDDVRELADFVAFELARTGRGMLIANPIPEDEAISPATFEGWLAMAEEQARSGKVSGRDVTPAVLAKLHEVSGGATLRANLALIRNNTDVAAQLCAALKVAL